MFEWFCILMCIIYTMSVIYNFFNSIFLKKAVIFNQSEEYLEIIEKTA